MGRRHFAFLLATGLIGIFVFSACSSSPDEPDDESVAEQPQAAPDEQSDGLPPLDVDRSHWSDERQAVDASVDAFLASPNNLDEAMQRDVAAMAGVAEEKAARLTELRSQLTDLIETSDNDSEIVAWSQFRIAQTYLNFGCQLQNVTAPEGVEPEMKQEYRMATADLARPLFEEAQQEFRQARQPDVTPWSDHAVHILDELEHVVDDTDTGSVCTNLEKYWQLDADEVQVVDHQDVESIGVREIMSEEVENDSVLDSLFRDDEIQPNPDVNIAGGSFGDPGYGRVEVRDDDNEADDNSLPSPTTELHDPTVGDHCDDSAVRRVVQARENAFQHCYERHLQTDPDLGGEVTYSWTIDLDGTVTDVEIDDSSMNDEGVESCQRRIIERLRFAEPDGETCDVAYPMEFMADDEE